MIFVSLNKICLIEFCVLFHFAPHLNLFYLWNFFHRKCPVELISPLIKIIIDEVRKDAKKHPISYGFNQIDNVYEPLKLMQSVMGKTNEILQRYLDNSKLCSLPSPSGRSYSITSAYAIKNCRRSMEDRHVVIHDLNTIFNKPVS